jgi:5-methylcytosine-specific restriction endonuclease McrA
MPGHNEHRDPYKFEYETKQKAKERCKNLCEGCGKNNASLEADHIIPIYFAIEYPVFAQAVIKSLANIRMLCHECHTKRMHYNEDEILLLAYAVLARFIEQEKKK